MKNNLFGGDRVHSVLRVKIMFHSHAVDQTRGRKCYAGLGVSGHASVVRFRCPW